MIKKTIIIKPYEYYSIHQVHELDVFTWIKSYDTLRRWIQEDLKRFKVIKRGQGNGTRYFIKGSTLIRFQEQIKQGLDFTV